MISRLGGVSYFTFALGNGGCGSVHLWQIERRLVHVPGSDLSSVTVVLRYVPRTLSQAEASLGRNRRRIRGMNSLPPRTYKRASSLWLFGSIKMLFFLPLIVLSATAILPTASLPQQERSTASLISCLGSIPSLKVVVPGTPEYSRDSESYNRRIVVKPAAIVYP